MRPAALAAWLVVAAAACAGAAHADPTTRLIEVIGEKQSDPETGAASATSIRVTRKKPCGTRADLFLCGTFAHAATGRPTRGAVRSPAIRVAAPKDSKVLVTWTGSLYCERSSARPRPEASEYVVTMQIHRDKASPVTPNEEGSLSVGRREPARSADPDEADRAVFELHPVTLTRTFEATRSAPAEYFALFDVDFRQGDGFCNVNGGAMTAVVVE